MPRKEQLTITLDAELTRKLREKAQKGNVSLSSVIEKYLQSVDSLTGKTDIQRVLEILGDIKQAVEKQENMATAKEGEEPHS